MAAPSPKYVQDVDVFASYAFEDTERDTDPRVFISPDQFIEDLKRLVLDRSDIRLNIRGVQEPASGSLLQTMEKAIQDTPIFLAFLSTWYARSEAALQELQIAMEMAKNDQTDRLVVPIYLEHVSLGDITEDVVNLKGSFLYSGDLKLQSKSGEDITPDASEHYQHELSDLADAIIVHIHQMSFQSGSIEPLDKENSKTPENQTERPMWLVQYKPSQARNFEERLAPGLVEEWRIHPFGRKTLRKKMLPGDPVVIWRAMDGNDNGGIVGWGSIKSLEKLDDSRIEMYVSHEQKASFVPRETVLKAIDQVGTSWPNQGSLGRLDKANRGYFWEQLPQDWVDANESTIDEQQETEETTETRFSSDRPETMRDMLGRAPLAFALAHRINDIYGKQNDAEPNQDHDAPDDAAFILHIDSPWGGGKTTFANFVARILNPKAHGVDPAKPDTLKNTIFENLKLHDPDRWPLENRMREWKTVHFNAWQHQHVQPPWWDFYETIRKQTIKTLPYCERFKAKWSERIWRIITPKTGRDALGFFFITLLSVLMFFLAQKFEWGKSLVGSDGDNLANLIIAAVSGTSGLALIKSARETIKTLISSAGESTDADTLGTDDPLRRFREHFGDSIKKLGQPVIVIVDDLDRCEPAYVVELIRGMLTMFRSPHVVFVLLGDSNWIKSAFALVHKDMARTQGADSIQFGGRFVEKAIQMSLLLPQPDEDSRYDYIDGLLLGHEAGGKLNIEKEDIDALQTFRSELEADLKAADTGEKRNAVAEKARAKALAFDPDIEEVATKLVNAEKSMRAASAAKSETEIRHAIAPMKIFLPPNPRQIKRIVNNITMYQASAQVSFAVDEGSQKWFQLVLWIVLMSNHPNCWRTFCKHPEQADLVIEHKGEIAGEDITEKFRPLYDSSIKEIMRGSGFSGHNIILNTEAVGWLRLLTPVA